MFIIVILMVALLRILSILEEKGRDKFVQRNRSLDA